MPDDFEYKGWVIAAYSYPSDFGRWRPRAVVRIVAEGRRCIQAVPAPLDVTRATQEDAHAYAIEMAMKWIDEKG